MAHNPLPKQEQLTHPTADTSSVRFEYVVEPLGASLLPTPIRDRVIQMFAKFVNQVQARLPDDHFAFGLRTSHPDSGVALDALINRFDSTQLTAVPDAGSAMLNVFRAVASRVQDSNVRRLVNTILASNPGEIRVDQVIHDKILSILKVSSADLRQWYVPGDPVLRLHNTPVATRFGRFIGEFGLGNKRATTVSRLDFDLTTYCVHSTVSIRHRHSWGSLKSLIGA